MSLVYLVGTVHWDLKGPERLRKFLGYIRPGTIGLEASEELIKQRLKDREQIKQLLEEEKRFNSMIGGLYKGTGKENPKSGEDLVLQFAAVQGYEFWTSYEHKLEENPIVEIVPMHTHEFLTRKSKEIYSKAFNQVSAETGHQFLDQKGEFTKDFCDEISTWDPIKLQSWIDENYQDTETTAQIAREDPNHAQFLKDADDAMEQKVRELVEKNDGHIVIPVGHAHVFTNYENNLYTRLKDLSPTRIRLSDVDRF